MLSKSLTQLSVNWWGCILSLLCNLRPNYGGGNEDNGGLLQKAPCSAALSAPSPATGHHQPTPLLETPGPSWASMGQSLVGSLFLSPGSCCTQIFVCAFQESVSPVLCKFWQLYGEVMVTSFKRAYAITHVCCTRSPCPCGRPLLAHTSAGDTQIQFWLSL